MPNKLDKTTDIKADWIALESRVTPPRKEVYIASEDLLTATQLAITLGRPLLLRGEPGCGKTRFSHAIAEALGTDIVSCIIKSTTKASDLLYRFDAIRRLYDAQPGGEKLDVSNQRYVELGPLGKAIQQAAQEGATQRVIVLLDEVDKADLDFPNDLLHELDRLEFTVAETNETFMVPKEAPHLRPLVILTHNEEKPLPGPFLRRCVSFEIEFPSDDQLKKILTIHGHSDTSARTVAALEVLARLRDPKLELSRAPGLSEFLDWVSFAEHVVATPDELKSLKYGEALVKTKQDREKAKRALTPVVGP